MLVNVHLIAGDRGQAILGFDMDPFIQICLLVYAVSVSSQQIPLDFLDRELDGPLKATTGPPLSPLEMFGLKHDFPRLFDPAGGLSTGVRLGGLYGDQAFETFGISPQYPQDKDIGSPKHGRNERLPAPVTEIDALDIKPEDAVINTHNYATEPHSDKTHIDPRIDNGPLKVTLLSETTTEKVIPALKTNANKTVEDPTNNKHLHSSHVAATTATNISNRELKNKDQIIFPDEVNTMKSQINGQPQHDNKTSYKNDTIYKQDMNLTKNTESILMPVQVIPNQMAYVNTYQSQNGNTILPSFSTGGAIPNNQVLVITNDVFPTRGTPQQSNPTPSVGQGNFYTNILNLLQNGQPALLMPVNTYPNTDAFSTNVSPDPGNNGQNVNGVTQRMGIPSDIPQNPVIATLLTPKNLQNLGRDVSPPMSFSQPLGPSTRAQTLSNIPFNPIPNSAFQQGSTVANNVPRSSDNLAPLTANLQTSAPLNNIQTAPTQNMGVIQMNGQTNSPTPQQYYVVNLPNNGNSNNQQPIIMNLQGNIATNVNNGLDNAQKYMLVTVNNQQNLPQNQGNNNMLYTLVNSNPNTPLISTNNIQNGQQIYQLVNSNTLNGQINSVNGNGQNLYALVTIPNNVQSANSNTLQIGSSPLGTGYQNQDNPYALVSMKDSEGDPASNSNSKHNDSDSQPHPEHSQPHLNQHNSGLRLHQNPQPHP